MFNEEYSKDVPLARIFDQLMFDNEQPSVILNFLDINHDALKDILTRGTCAARLFQLDFIVRCKRDEVEKLIELVKTTDSVKYSYGPLMAWQMFGCKSPVVASLKVGLKNELNNLISSCPSARHPYRWGMGRDARQFDALIAEMCLEGCVPDGVASWPLKTLEKYVRVISHSMYAKRIFQFDVYEKLEPEKRFVMLAFGGKDCWGWDIEPLMVQVLDSNESVEEKEKALEVYREFDYEFQEDSFMSEILSCKSFSQILMKTTLVGAFELRSIIIELLRRNKLKILKDWIKHGKEEFNLNLNVSDLVEHLDSVEHMNA